MTDELVKRLRSMHWCVTTEANGVGVSDRKVALEAADCIEALTAERDGLNVSNMQMLGDIAVAMGRIEQLTAERDAAYASGYSDAETEISQSVLGLENTFLHSQYADAKLRIEDLQAQTMRLSGMVHDLKKEVAISDALLIGEAEASLERLARAEAAEAESARLRDELEELDFLRHEGGPDSVAALEADRDRLQKALTDAGAYIDKGQDKMAFNIIRAALGVSA